MKKTICIAFLCCLILTLSGLQANAEEYGIDVSGYLGGTIGDVLRDFSDLYQENDLQGSGRDFLTNGEVCFYYEYLYSENERGEDKRVNRIVLNGDCGADYRIGQLPGGSTYGDENVYLTSMGYEFLYGTDDLRHFWIDDQDHLIIVARGKWAGACETDYSLITSYDFWEWSDYRSVQDKFSD